jgi:hypothetical protein
MSQMGHLPFQAEVFFPFAIVNQRCRQYHRFGIVGIINQRLGG